MWCSVSVNWVHIRYEAISVWALSGDPALEVARLQLALEAYDVFLEIVLAPQLAGLKVPLDILLVKLVDGQFAEVALGLGYDLFSVVAVYGPQAIGLELWIINGMFVLLIEDKMEYPFGLDLPARVGSPYLIGSHLKNFIIGFDLGHDDEFFERIIEMFLVIMEGRVG